MEFSIKCCIGCMAAHTSADCVNFKIMTEIPNEHHNRFIFNQINDMYITSLVKFMNEIFESFPNLFFDQMLKKWMISISKSGISYQKSLYGTNRINKLNKCILQENNWWIFWVMLVLQNSAMSLRIFLDWIKKLWNKVLLFLFRPIQELLSGEIKILMN